MLYNPKWDKPSLASFISFLETQDPNKKYNWYKPKRCAVGQYLARMSLENWSVACGDLGLTQKLNRIAQDGEWTFGACLERARKALKLQSR